MKKKHKIAAAILTPMGGLAFYVCCGLFVIQPIGALPEGMTILYWRVGTNLPFVASADGILLERSGSVSLIGRAIALGKLAEPVHDRKFLTLRYSEWLYLVSTGGKKFNR